MIREVKKYTDDDGKSVTAYVPKKIQGDSEEHLRGSKAEDLTMYEGQVGIQTPMGIAPVRFNFPDDYTLERCFEEFEDIANVEVEKQIKEAEDKARNENLIVTPGQVNQSGGTIPFPHK